MKQFLNAKFTAILIILIVGITDYIIPLGVSVGVLYLISLPVLISEKKVTIIGFAILISLLILFNLLYFSKSETSDYIYINRALSVFSIWIISYVLIRYKILKDRKEAIKERQKKALEEMLFITNHKVRHPIATLLGISEILANSQFSENERQEVLKLMREPIHDLNDFTEELTEFMVKQKDYTVR